MASSRKKFFWLWRVLALLPVPVLWCVVAHYGWLNFVENKALDWRFHYRGEIMAPVKVVYVEIDSKSLDPPTPDGGGGIGGWPWDRHYFSDVAQALIEKGGAKSVGFDLVLSDNGMAQSADPDKMELGNKELRRFLIKQPNPPVVLAASYVAADFHDPNKPENILHRELSLIAGDTRKIEDIEPPELPTFYLGAGRPKWTPPNIGLIDTIDGGTRWVPLFAPSSTRTYFHMAVELARHYWGLPLEGVKIHDDRLEFVREGGTVLASVPLRQRQLLEVNWFSPWASEKNNPRYSFLDIHTASQFLKSDKPEEAKQGEAFFGSGEFKDAIVLVGPTDPLLQDLAMTSFDDVPVPRVGLHGNVFKTIIAGEFLRRPSEPAGYAIVAALTLLVTVLAAAGGARAMFAKVMAVLAAAVYVALAFQLFKSGNWVLPMVAPLGAAFTTSFGALIWQVIDEQRAKGRIKGMFGAYVSPQLVERMVESGTDPKLGGHDAEITAYFSDIQSFSTFSEKLGSGPLVELMNEYLTACTDIVQAEGGTLDKYIGDAVVAMFGAPIPLPDHAYRACVASQLVHRKLGELRAKWQSEGSKWPEIVWRMQTRVGLNSGQCMIGNMGSRTRFNYTMMGDNVNLAARMESGSKAYGAYTMVAEATKLACEQHGGDRLVFRYLDKIVVKGRTIAVPIYEVVGLKEDISDQTRDCLGVFADGISRYLVQDWDGAEARFRKSAEIEPNIPGKTPGVENNPSLTLIKRCDYWRTHPPGSDWNGVYEMKEK